MAGGVAGRSLYGPVTNPQEAVLLASLYVQGVHILPGCKVDTPMVFGATVPVGQAAISHLADNPVSLIRVESPSKLARRGIALQSILSGGCIVAGGFVKDSVLGRNVFIDAGARVEASILFDNVYVGRGARVSRAIVDKNVRIPEGDHIGHDLARDAIRYTVSEGGTTVVQKARDTLLTRSRNF